MRKMGEQYEVVVFTASLSKVNLIHSVIRLSLLSKPLFVFIVCRSCFGHVGYTQGCKTSAIQGGVLQLQRHLRQGMLYFAAVMLATMRITKAGFLLGVGWQRTFPSWDVISPVPLYWIIPLPVTYSTMPMLFPYLHGSTILTTPNSATWWTFCKISQKWTMSPAFSIPT